MVYEIKRKTAPRATGTVPCWVGSERNIVVDFLLGLFGRRCRFLFCLGRLSAGTITVTQVAVI
jgi:hypothetical protein